jgi:hypothetical protein
MLYKAPAAPLENIEDEALWMTTGAVEMQLRPMST